MEEQSTNNRTKKGTGGQEQFRKSYLKIEETEWRLERYKIKANRPLNHLK